MKRQHEPALILYKKEEEEDDQKPSFFGSLPSEVFCLIINLLTPCSFLTLNASANSINRFIVTHVDIYAPIHNAMKIDPLVRSRLKYDRYWRCFSKSFLKWYPQKYESRLAVDNFGTSEECVEFNRLALRIYRMYHFPACDLPCLFSDIKEVQYCNNSDNDDDEQHHQHECVYDPYNATFQLPDSIKRKYARFSYTERRSCAIVVYELASGNIRSLFFTDITKLYETSRAIQPIIGDGYFYTTICSYEMARSGLLYDEDIRVEVEKIFVDTHKKRRERSVYASIRDALSLFSKKYIVEIQ